MIDKKKTYETRNGFPVKIKKITDTHVTGLVKTPAYGWAETTWYSNGDFSDDFEETSLDLIEVKDEK
jgi:hypothetical protein